jgi:hypothetical protein
VPQRNPYTGENIDGFQREFIELRAKSLPSWSPRERFDHFYRLSTNTRVASSESGKSLQQNDLVELL